MGHKDGIRGEDKGDEYRIPSFIKIVLRWEEEGLERTIFTHREISSLGIEEEPNEESAKYKERINPIRSGYYSLLLSLRLMKETMQELRHVSQFHKRDDLRTYAYSALDLTVGVLNEFRLVLGKLETQD